MNRETITVVGAGGIGGTLAGFLKMTGERVQVVEVGPHLEAIRGRGLRLEGVRGEHQVTFDGVVAPHEVQGPLALVFIATRANRTRDALEVVAPHLAEDALVVSTQNGLNAQTIMARIGERRTIPCMVHMAATQVAPGVVTRFAEGDFYIGAYDGSVGGRVRDLARRMSPAIPTHAVENVWGYIWCKLVACAQTEATGLVDASAGEVRQTEWARRILIALELEVVDAALAGAVRLEGYERIDPQVLLDVRTPETLRRALDTLLGPVGKPYGGTWRELKLGILPETDEVTGAVVRVGRRHGLPMTLTGRLVELIHDVAAGRRRQSWDTLREMTAPAEALLEGKLRRGSLEVAV